MRSIIGGAIVAVILTIVSIYYLAGVAALGREVDWINVLQLALFLAPFAAIFGAIIGSIVDSEYKRKDK